jgi:nicotinate dehydrogenase subunit A
LNIDSEGEGLMANEVVLNVNGRLYSVQASPDTPLLYVLRNDLGLNGPQFGCGSEQCGACMVIVGTKAAMSCKLPISEIGRAPITTLEGLSIGDELHPVQRAFIEQQAAQCGYCTNGMIMTAVALLSQSSHLTDAQIRQALDGNLCRCGAHLRILRAVKRAEELLWGGAE